MSFLAPLYLALAAAVGVPLLLHLLRRHIATRVDFPAARYLLRAEAEHSRSLRLRNLLLMLLRLCDACLVLFLGSCPVFTDAGQTRQPLFAVVSQATQSAQPMLSDVLGV